MAHRWQLAQINVATALFPPDDERIQGFYAELERINRLADESPGFVWRLQSESGNATDIDIGDDPLLLANMSVWSDVQSLFDFAYKTAHTKVMAQRRQWFQRPEGAYQVLWWVPAGHIPTIEEGLSRLDELRANGATPRAFTFKASYPPPGDAGEARDHRPDRHCSGWT